MKTRILISAISLFAIIIASGQNQFNIVDNSATWSVITNNLGNYYTQYIRIGSEDTLINGLYYRKIYNCYDPIPVSWTFMDLFIREDTETRKVFMRDLQGDEALIYDFSLETSDTVIIRNVISGPNFKLKVIDIDSVLIYDSYRKRYHFEPLTWPYSDVWIEGIGSINYGIVYCGYSNTSPWYIMLCYKLNDNVYYINPDYTACYYPYVSISENELKNYKVYYNPNSNIVQIENMPIDLHCEFELYNLLGQKIICTPFSSNSRFFLGNFGLKDGLYIYVIKHKEYIFSEKLMIKK
jgi:hypothetical protein